MKLSHFYKHKNDGSAALQAALQYCTLQKCNLFCDVPEVVIKNPVQINLTHPFAIFGPSRFRLSWDCPYYGIRFNLSGAGALQMRGIHFDGDNQINTLVEVHSSSPNTTIEIQNCVFERAFWKSGEQYDACGLQIRGGFQNVQIKDCQFCDISRAKGCGIPSSRGSQGMTIFPENEHLYAQNVTVEGCTFKNVSNSEPKNSPLNFDCDCLSISTPCQPSGMGHQTTIIQNNTFQNCKGRGIKGQVPFASVLGNTFLKTDGSCTNEGYTDINLQYGAGLIQNNTSKYEAIAFDGDFYPYSFYTSAKCGKNIIQVLSNKVESTDTIRCLLDVRDALTRNVFLEASGNKWNQSPAKDIILSDLVKNDSLFYKFKDNKIKSSQSSFINNRSKGGHILSVEDQ
jgi:hypothetical protein